MLKLKNILPVFVVLLFLGVASTAFAQVSCNVASTPVSRDSNTGVTEPAGDITFQCVQTGASASTAGATITVSYGIPITNDTSTVPTVANGYAMSKTVSVLDPNVAGCLNPTSVIVSNAVGSVVIQVPAVGTGVGTTCNYTLTGVLLGLDGTGATSVVATVSVSPGNNLLITAGQNTPTVVTSVLAPIVSAGVTQPLGPGIVPTTGASASFSTVFSIKVTENYIDMFRDITTFNGGASSNGVELLFTFSGIPTGATLQNCAASQTTGAAPTISATTATSVLNTITLTTGAGISLSAVDSITLKCGLLATDAGGPTAGFGNGTAALPLTAGAITATVSLAPVGQNFSTIGAVLNNPTTTGQIPRYTGPQFGPFTVINIIPLTTHMIWPYISIGNGFDTGFVVANTSADPYGPKAGGAATGLNGPVTIAFYPNNGGSPFCVSTGAGAATVFGVTSCTTVSVGTGLTSGVVNAGSSWVVLGSQLLAAVSGAPSAMSGYAFGIANFPFGHPTGFVADATFSGKFASGGPALVLQNPAVAGRQTFPGSAGLAESLGH